MSWLFWAGVVTACGASYQLLVKMLAGQAPVYFITACIGAIVLLGSSIMLATSQQTVSISQLGGKTLSLILLLGVVTFGLEVGYNLMYKAGAPLTYARMLTTAGVGLILVAAGVLLYNEKLSPYQLAGIMLIIAGLGMLTLKGNAS